LEKREMMTTNVGVELAWEETLAAAPTSFSVGHFTLTSADWSGKTIGGSVLATGRSLGVDSKLPGTDPSAFDAGESWSFNLSSSGRLMGIQFDQFSIGDADRAQLVIGDRSFAINPTDVVEGYWRPSEEIVFQAGQTLRLVALPPTLKDLQRAMEENLSLADVSFVGPVSTTPKSAWKLVGLTVIGETDAKLGGFIPVVQDGPSEVTQSSAIEEESSLQGETPWSTVAALMGADVAITSFVPDPNDPSKLRVGYNVTGTAANFQIKIYRALNASSHDGNPALVASAVISGSVVGNNQFVNLAANLGSDQVGGLKRDDYLMAVVEFVGGVADDDVNNNKRLFDGGAFKDGATGTVYYFAANNSTTDLIRVASTGGVNPTYQVLRDTGAGYAPIYQGSPFSEIHVRTYAGNDRVEIVDPALNVRLWAFGGAGNDTIYGAAGNDYLSGGNNVDTIYGLDGQDEILGGSGVVVTSGKASGDLLFGGSANDRINGDAGPDYVDGGTGDDILYGGDEIDGYGGYNAGYGDQMLGGDGNDLLFGGVGDDDMFGGAGDDILYGNSGNDSLRGGANNDILVQGTGNGTVTWIDGQAGVHDPLVVRTLIDEDETLGSETFGITDLSLREALAVASAQNGNDAIEFAPNVTGTLGLSGTALFVNSNVSIKGNGISSTIIDAKGLSGGVYVPPGVTASLDGLKITGGGNVLEGGGIYNSGTLTLNNVEVSGNTSTGTGGGITNRNYTSTGVNSLYIIDSTISNNHSQDGSGIAAYMTAGGGGALGSLEISGSTIADNVTQIPISGPGAQWSSAGGLLLTGSLSSALIKNSTFSGNSAQYGGAIRLWAVTSALKIVNSTIVENRGLESGGIHLYSNSTPPIVHNSIIAENWTHQSVPGRVDVNGTLDASSSYNIFGAGAGTSSFSGTTNQVGAASNLINPRLAPLGDYGGKTKTHALLKNSPAIDRGGNQQALLFTSGVDQRGRDRYENHTTPGQPGFVDVGAFELAESLIAVSEDNPMFVAGDGPVAVAAGALLDSLVTSITLTLEHRPDGGNERLSASPTNPAIKAAYKGGVLTLTGAANVGDYQQALRSVTYDNVSENPNTTNRPIRIDILQGSGVAATATVTVDPRVRGVVNLPIASDFSVYGMQPPYEIDDGLFGSFLAGSAAGSVRDNTAYLQFLLPDAIDGMLLENAEIGLSTQAFYNPTTGRFVQPREGQSLALFDLGLNAFLPPGSSSQPAPQLGYYVNVATAAPVALLESKMAQRSRANVTTSIANALAANKSFFSLGIIDADNDPNKSFWAVLGSSGFSNADASPALTVTGLFKQVPPLQTSNDAYVANKYVPLIVPAAQGVLANETALLSSLLPTVEKGRVSPQMLTLSAELVEAPAAGALTLNRDGSFTYVPDDSSSAGIVSFSYRAFNGVSYSPVTQVAIKIDATQSIRMNPVKAWVTSPDGSGSDLFESTDVLKTNPRFHPVGWYQNVNGTLPDPTEFPPAPEPPPEQDADPVIPPTDMIPYPYPYPIPDPDDEIDPGYGMPVPPGGWWFPNGKNDDEPIDYLGIPRKSSFLQYDLVPTEMSNATLQTLTIQSAVLFYSASPTDLTEYAPPLPGLEFVLTNLAQRDLEETPSFRVLDVIPEMVPEYGVVIENAGANSVYRGGAGSETRHADVTQAAQELWNAVFPGGVLIDNKLIMTLRVDGMNLAAGSIHNPRLVVTYSQPETPVTNNKPEFTSTRITEAVVGQPYYYESTATDQEKDPLTFSLDPGIVWPPGYTPAPGHTFQMVNQGPGETNPAPYERGVVTWTPDASLAGQTVTIVEIVTDSFGNVESRPIQILVKADPQNRAPEIINTAPDKFGILDLLPPQVIGEGLAAPTDVSKGVVEGQTWLDIGADGKRNSFVGLSLPIQLATDGIQILTSADDNFTSSAEFYALFPPSNPQDPLSPPALPPGIDLDGDILFAGKDESGDLVPFDFEFFTDSEGFPQTRNSFFINNNGSITFDAGDAEYTPQGLSLANLARIAPFWADVDTRATDSGAVYLARGMSPPRDATGRRNPFVQIDWRDVGYFVGHADKRNDFSLYIEDDPDGDIVAFVYRNMEWTTGDIDGSDGFGVEDAWRYKRGAEIGFAAGNGTDFVRLGVVDGSVIDTTDPLAAPYSPEMLEPFQGSDKKPVIFAFRIGDDGKLQRHDEPGVDGFLVELVDVATQTVVASQISRSVDLNGNGIIENEAEIGLYRFVDVPAGNYEVRVQTREGWRQTYRANGESIPISISGADRLIANPGFARIYEHQVEAIDYDAGDTITYSLTDGPSDAHIDSQTGKLTWLPRTPGDYQFTIVVEDNGKLIDTESFVLKVTNDTQNVPPQVTSKPPAGVRAGDIFSYRIRAYDANLDPLVYELVSGPSGLTVTPDGQVRWQTTAADVDDHPVVVRIIDREGRLPANEEYKTEFTVHVVPPLQNKDPEIDSSPPLQGIAGRRYFYAIDATDPEGDDLSYELVSRIDGMKIQNALGYVDWTPRLDQVGRHDVVIRVNDKHGKHTLHSFTVEVVEPNVAPKFTSQPSGAGIDAAFVYRLSVKDDNGDNVDLSLPSAPVGMQLLYDVNGPYLHWATPVIGQHSVKIVASDGRAPEVAQEFVLNVTNISPPQILGTPQFATPVGKPYEATFTIKSKSPLGSLGSQLKLDADSIGRGIVINTASVVTTQEPGTNLYVYSGVKIVWTPGVTGEYPITLIATNNGGSVSKTSFDLTVAPRVNLTSPPKLTDTPANAPKGPAVLNQTPAWAYSPSAQDPDVLGSAVTFTSLAMPPGATFNGATFSWTPTSLAAGTFRFKATDATGDYAIFEFTVPVVAAAAPQVPIALIHSAPELNHGPQFQDSRIGPLAKDRPFAMQLSVGDVDGHRVTTFAVDASKTTAPGFTAANLDAAGKISWTPSQSGSFKIAIRATDEFGAPTTVVFSVIVADNAVPTLKAGTITRANINQVYTHDFTISDPNPDDTLTVTLGEASKALGMTLFQVGTSTTWRLSWGSTSNPAIPRPTTPGYFPIEISVVDDKGEGRSYSFPLAVQDPQAAPSLPPLPNPLPIRAEREFSFDLGALQASYQHFTYRWAAGSTPPVGATITSDGLLRWAPKFAQISPGVQTYTIAITATNDANVDHPINIVVKVIDPSTPGITPQITSTAPRQTTAGETLTYDLTKNMTNHQLPVRWLPHDVPAGMVVDEATGRVSWTPDKALIGAKVKIALRVVDVLGFGEIQEFDLEVVGVNQKPLISSSSLPSEWRVGMVPKEFQISATDPEGHAIEFLALTPPPFGAALPSGLSIDPSGVLTLPNLTVAGPLTFVMRVQEKHNPGSYAESTYTINVLPAGANLGPRVSSAPDLAYATVAPGGYANKFFISVSDPDATNQGFTYQIVEGLVSGMSIAPTAGVPGQATITWTPGPGEVNDRVVTVKVTDQPTAGGTAKSIYRSFTLRPVQNLLPVVPLNQRFTVARGDRLSQTVEANDPEQGDLTFAIDLIAANQGAALAAQGLTIDNSTGQFSWRVPASMAVGDNVVTVLVTDKFGATTSRNVTIAVKVDDVAPLARVQIIDPASSTPLASGGKLVMNSVYPLTIQLSDNVQLGAFTPGKHYVTFTSAQGTSPPTELTSARTDFTFTPPAVGLYTVTVHTEDAAQNKTEETFRFFVVDALSNAVATILAPTGGEPVTTLTKIVGTVDANSSAVNTPTSYYIDLIDVLSGEPVKRLLNVNSPTTPSQAANAELATLDPTLFEDGSYRLRLVVYNPANNAVLAIDEQRIEILNAMKLGDLDIAFTDLSVNLGGIPVNLSRSYDSKRSETLGDFGYGWNLNFLDGSVVVDHPQGHVSSLTQEMPIGTRVLVTLPDGSTQGFTFQVSGGRPTFMPDDDVSSRLELTELPNHLTLQRSWAHSDGTVVDNDGDPFVASYWARDLRLMTRAGVGYHFSFATGELIGVSDRQGHRIDIESTAAPTGGAPHHVIRTEDGSQTVKIYRSATTGFITKIEDPNGKSIEYDYGVYTPGASTPFVVNAVPKELGRIKNRVGAYTHYTYRDLVVLGQTVKQNLLTGVYDGNVRLLTADYNEEGRLNLMQDAAGGGAKVAFSLSLGDGRSVEHIEDQEGNFIDIVRDARGNVVMRVIPLFPPATATTPAPALDDQTFLVTEMVYDEENNLLRESLPYKVTKSSQRYQQHAPDPVTMPSAWARRMEYEFNRLVKSIDALGNVTLMKYDDEDRVIASTDANGVISHSVYDNKTGDLLERYSTKGDSGAKFNRTRYVYQNGRVTDSYQVAADGTEILLSHTEYYDSGVSLGLAKSTTDAAGVTRYFGYDNNGNQTHSWSVWTNPNQAGSHVTLATVNVYDEEGRVKETRQFELLNKIVTTHGALLTELTTATPSSTTSTLYDSQGRVTESTDGLGAVTYTRYDVRGSVIETRSPAKNDAGVAGWLVTRTLYDSQGRLAFTADPYFVTATDYATNVNANASNLLGSRSLYDHLGRVRQTERHSGVQINLTSVNGQWTATLPGNFVWDDDVAAAPNSNRRSFSASTYDDVGRVQYAVSETGARTDYYYDATGRQIAVLDPAVTIGGQTVRNLTESFFDPGGRLIESRTKIAITSAANAHPDIYDPAFNLSLRNDSARQTTVYEYDAAGRQTAVIATAINDPDDASAVPARIHLRTETIYDDFGRRIASIEGLKQSDPFNPTTIVRTHERRTDYEYDAEGSLTAVVLPSAPHPNASLGLVRPRYEYVYDQYGNRTDITDNVLHVSTGVGEDDHENNGSVDSRTTKFVYDHRGRQTSRQLPEGVAAGTAAFTEKMFYDDRPRSAIGATPQASTGLGQLKYSVDFEGRVTAYFYDNTATGGGRLVRKDYFENETLYDNGAGPVVDRVAYVYDAFGRTLTVTQQFAINDPPNARTRLTTNAYDAEGRLTRIATPEGTVNHEYDLRTGQLIRTYTGAPLDSGYASTDGDGKAITDIRYSYDNLGRLVQVISVERLDVRLAGTAAPTQTVAWIDAAGASQNVTGEVTTYAYDLIGNLSRVKLPNSVTVDHAYDELNRLTRMVNYVDSASTGTVGAFDGQDLLRSSFDYEIDLFHKRTGVVEKINHGDANNSTVVESHIDWVYDNLGRLTKETYNQNVAAGSTNPYDFIADYAFDLVGNRLSKKVDHRDQPGVDEAFAYDYDRNDRLVRERHDATLGTPAYDETTFYQYDNPNVSGSVMDGTVRTAVTKYANDLSSPSGNKLSESTFQYDLRGRMKASSVDDDGAGANQPVSSAYAYNDDGIRVMQSVGGVATHYVVDDQNPTGYAQVLEEKQDANGNGTIQDGEVAKSYVIGHDVIAQAAQAAAAMFLIYDGHGSTRALLDAAADIGENVQQANQKQLFSYDAYGNLVVAPDLVVQVQAALTSLLYSGEKTDAATGLQYLRARYYSALTGTFSTLDPFRGNVDDPQSLHKYLYTHGDPINGIDPSGEFLGLAIGVGLGLTVGLSALSLLTAAITLQGAIVIGLATAGAIALIGFYNSQWGTSLPATEQMRVATALTLLPGNVDQATVQAATVTRFQRADTVQPDAWGYNYPLISDEVILGRQLLSSKDPEIIASTIVHELQHTMQNPFTKHHDPSEKEAYQKQSDFLRALGFQGKVLDLRSDPRFVNDDEQKQLRTEYFTDLAENFRKYGITNPAVR